MPKKKYVWFVQPLNSHTNEVLSRELAEENLWHSIFCEDGITRTLWECPIRIIRYLWESKNSLGIEIKVYNVCGPSKKFSGRIRECTFLFKKKYLAKPRLRKERKNAKA